MRQTLRAGAHHRGTSAVYCVEGALDLRAAAEVLEVIGRLLQRGLWEIDVDLSQLDDIDSVGFSVFVTAHYQCLDAGVRLRFLNASPLIARLLRNNGLDEILDLVRSDLLVGQTDEPDDPEQLNDLVASVPRAHGAHGRFDSRAHRRSPWSWLVRHW
jgi:anti-anti-sigma factor